jgi:hypothetical protein
MWITTWLSEQYCGFGVQANGIGTACVEISWIVKESQT